MGGEALDYWAALREHGETALAKAIEEAKAAGVEVETLVVERAPAEGLAELARERRRDMIVVGSTASGRSSGRSSARWRTSWSTSPRSRCWSFTRAEPSRPV